MAEIFHDTVETIEPNEEEEEEEQIELLKLCDQPISFEPISSLTNVFFDRDNQQIFCVRSNGVGGVIVKGLKTEHNISFRMEDKGSVATIKFSPNMNILAIRRKDKQTIDFLNFKNGQPILQEYSQTFKAKSTKFQECYWLDVNEILLVSEQGFEHYQIFPDKRALKLVKYFSMALNWLIWSREAQVFLVSTGTYGSILNPFVYTKGSFIKLPKFEVDLPLPLNLNKYRLAAENNSSTNRYYYLNESDVVLGRIYNEFYVMIIRQMSSEERKLNKNHQSYGYSEIAMYKLLTDNPAKKTNILKINLSGRFTLNIVDELIIVHHRASFSSLIFDIKMRGEFDGYTISNYPIIKKASIQASKSSSIELIEMYSMNWIMFLPNVIIDAKLGCFWTIELNLESGQSSETSGDLRVFRNEFENDYLKLCEFLLNRKKTKQHLLNVCHEAIQTNSSLELIAQIFNKINEFYKISLLLFPINNNENVNSSEDTLLKSLDELNNERSQLPIIEQYEMHNHILYPMLEDEQWWSTNSKYTISIIIEYFNSLNQQYIQIEHYLYKLLVNAFIKANRLYQLHQYLQYHVFSDSKPLACLLLSIQSTYPAANQLALDMLKRLGTANEEIVDVLLSNGLILSALRFSMQILGLADQLNPVKFLEQAKSQNDPIIFHEVFKFFEERNIRLRGNPQFKPEENCDLYVRHFMSLFQSKTSSSKSIRSQTHVN